MEKSLFHRNNPQVPAPTPHELIQPEVVHLQKRTSTRHGAAASRSTYPWLIILGCCILGGLYSIDPFIHAWDKGEAVRTYLYLHNYGTSPEAAKLAATQILSRDEVETLNRRNGSFQDYYSSLDAATRNAEAIIRHTTRARLLRAGDYKQLGPLGKVRYFLFIRTGIGLPTDWSILDPSVGA